jgi:hypothetical protein
MTSARICDPRQYLAITRGVGATYLDNLDDRSKNIRKQLDSNSDREKLDAMKRLIAVRCFLSYHLTTAFLTVLVLS